jgi:hypothetical protein
MDWHFAAPKIRAKLIEFNHDRTQDGPFIDAGVAGGTSEIASNDAQIKLDGWGCRGAGHYPGAVAGGNSGDWRSQRRGAQQSDARSQSARTAGSKGRR